MAPTRVEGSLDGQPVFTIERTHWQPVIQNWWKRIPAKPPSLPAEFSSRGALGLFVEEGAVFFRNVVLQPLPAKDTRSEGASP